MSWCVASIPMWELLQRPAFEPAHKGAKWIQFDHHDRAQDWCSQARNAQFAEGARFLCVILMVEELLPAPVLFYLWVGRRLEGIFSDIRDAEAWMHVYGDRLRRELIGDDALYIESIDISASAQLVKPSSKSQWDLLLEDD